MPFAPLKTAIACALLSFAAHAQSPALTKVDQPTNLIALPATVGGRVQPEASADLSAFPHAYESQWPGAYFKTAFLGSTLYLRIGQSHEILHVVVDHGQPLLLNNPQPGIYRLSPLGDEPHAVTVFVATESQDAPNIFGGFAIPPGERPLPVPRESRQIEFIGDSHTVGYGNTSPMHDCTTDQVWTSTDDTQAFGALTAAHYGAAYQVNAISGRGIVRNYNGGAGDTLPEAYPYILFNKRDKVDDPAWNPQVIVIALGTNDFSTPLNPGERWKTREQLHADYEATYVRYLKSLHASHPHASIIVWATGLANGEIEAEAQKVVQQARAQGIERLTYLPIDHLTFTGCHSHPSLADDKTISTRLEQTIDATPHIWDRP